MTDFAGTPVSATAPQTVDHAAWAATTQAARAAARPADQPALATVCRYLACLHASDTAGLVACFAPDGQVFSPFLGQQRAAEFFPMLARASQRSVITPLDLMVSALPQDGGARVAARFVYDWTLQDGRTVQFDCVDLFHFAPGADRIREMRIVYDTHPLRQAVGDKYAVAALQPDGGAADER